IEVCGNGVVDPGEQCDDANANPADGCDACMATKWAVTTLLGGNVAATTVPLDHPMYVAADHAGNIYFTEAGIGRIRRIDTNGTMTTIAGTGVPGFSGDGGPAVQAQLAYPTGIALDELGNIYVADVPRIRRIDARGIITTI